MQYRSEIISDIKIYRELHNLRKFVEQNNGNKELIKLTSYLLGKKFYELIEKGISVNDIMNTQID